MSTSVVKWSEALSNRVSIIIRRYIDEMKFATFMAVSFITFFPFSSGSILYHFIYTYVCMFYILLFNFVNYVFLLLCYIFLLLCYIFFCLFKYFYFCLCSVLGALFHCVVLCIVYV